MVDAQIQIWTRSENMRALSHSPAFSDVHAIHSVRINDVKTQVFERVRTFCGGGSEQHFSATVFFNFVSSPSSIAMSTSHPEACRIYSYRFWLALFLLVLSSNSLTLLCPSFRLTMPPRIPPPTTVLPLPSPHTHCTTCLRRGFSSTSQLEQRNVAKTRNRAMFWAWINTFGKNFVQPQDGFDSNYLTAYKPNGERRDANSKGGRARGSPRAAAKDGEDTADARALEDAAIEDTSRTGAQESPRFPFPMNRNFSSETILSEALRLEVWKRVQVEKQSVRQVSADLNIDMRRIGAVVRLVEVEKRMRAEVRPPTHFPSAAVL
jgi:hypothetical protein